MRKKVKFSSDITFFCMLTAGLFLLSACGKSEDNDIDAMSVSAKGDAIESDFEYQFVAESENGYYVWERTNQDRFYTRLLFMDKESGRTVPLCNKPDCAHEGKECNAYFTELTSYQKGGIYKEYLQFYEGDLYAVGLSEDDYVSIYRIRADGSAEWEIRTKLYRTDYSATGRWSPPELLIDDGYVYFVDWYQKIQKLERMPLDGGVSEVLFEGDSGASAVNIYRIKSNGGTLFFQVTSYSDTLPGKAVGSVYCCDPSTGQCSFVKELFGPYSVNKGFVYYGNVEGLCRYSIQEGITEILADQPMNMPYMILTRDYIIRCDSGSDGSTLTIYDYDGREITTVSNTLGLYWCFGGSSDMLFGEYADDRGSNLCFLNLNRPIGELRWEKLKVD
ncbi:MAG: DUF5050 domain-containing protein [bacterium]|nr:DUF5050 domain-containing protein [bacterium]